MKKRTIIIIVNIAAALLLIGVLAWNFIPRLALSALIKNTLPEFEAAQVFDSYDITDGSLKTINHDNYSVGIPEDFTAVDVGELDAQYYANSDKSCCVLLLAYNEPLNINLLSDEYYQSIEGMPSYIAVSTMEEAFESLGNGVIPDNTYNTFKSAALLDSGDYNFWSIENTVAYIVLGTIKASLPQLGEIQYIYERDDVRGFVTIKAPFEEQPVYAATVELYSADDLDTPHTLMIHSESLDTIYAIINSVEFN